jgi:transcriptional regulator with XRE-family HTH domain/tetratricopeptide (TPR) repeat protein
MNVTGPQEARLSRKTWDEPDMRRALADRDISAVYRLLRRVGMSQRHIAALTGQSQSEVSEILRGRQVMAYDVLVRVADGLGIPRGYMGLAYDPATESSMVGPPDDAQAKEEESVKRRNLLAHGTAMVFGTTVLGADRGQGPPSTALTPIPGQIGVMDVRQVEATTRAMRALDYQYGGGTCRDAVIAQLSWAQRLLDSSATGDVKQRLFRALGDLENLAGWTSFDVGLIDSARRHYATAMQFASRAGDSSLMSNIMYRVGRIYLHNREANEALKWFQLGQIAAQNAGSERAVAILCANEAWAYAMLKESDQATKLLDRAHAEMVRVNPKDEPGWASFFDGNELVALSGTTYYELAAHDPHYASIAVSTLTQSIAGYDDRMARSQAMNRSMLATSYLRQGDVTRGIQIGHQALTAIAAVQSPRALQRFQPLQIEAGRWAKRTNNADARELSHLIGRAQQKQSTSL